MKVALSVRGRYHAFDLARELQVQDQLAQLITTYPARLVERRGLERGLVTGLVSNEILLRLYNKLPQSVRRRFDAQLLLNERFERAACKALRPGADVFHGWSGSSLATLKRASELGMRTVLERSSAHMLHQRALIQDEYDRWGIDAPIVHPGIVAKELQEYEAADFICVPSHFVLDTFLAEGVAREKLLLVPYGTSMQSFYPKPKSDAVFRIMHCGYASLEKGCHYLIEAFASLALPQAELWFVGGISPHMRPFIERYSSPNIIFHGHQPQRELVDFYAQCDVLCAASVQDGFCVTVPQAMACGLPVVATHNVGASDLLTPSVDGEVIPAGDVEALRTALHALHADPDRCHAMGTAALERVRADYSWQAYGTRMSAAYHSILSPLDAALHAA